MSSRGGRELQLLSWTQRWAWTTNAATAATEGPVSKLGSLPTPSQEPAQPATAEGPEIQGSHDLGLTSLGEHMVHPSLLQLPAGLCSHRHFVHVPVVPTLSLPGLNEYVYPNQPLLLPPLTWVGNRHLRMAHMQRWGKNKAEPKGQCN